MAEPPRAQQPKFTYSVSVVYKWLKDAGYSDNGIAHLLKKSNRRVHEIMRHTYQFLTVQDMFTIAGALPDKDIADILLAIFKDLRPVRKKLTTNWYDVIGRNPDELSLPQKQSLTPDHRRQGKH